MKLIRVVAVLLALGLVAHFALPTAGVEAEDKKKITSLATFRLTDVDGTEIELDGDELRGKPVCFVFLATWSDFSIRQAKAVAAEASSAKYPGKLVFVSGGNERKIRGLREEFKVKDSLWFKAEDKVSSDFTRVFDPAKALNQIPALVLVDEKRLVAHASQGELSAAEIAGAFTAKAGK